MAPPLVVDLGMLRGMASRYALAADEIAEVDATRATAPVAAALPGSQTGRFAALCGESADAAFGSVAGRVRRLSELARESAEHYGEADWANADRLAEVGLL